MIVKCFGCGHVPETADYIWYVDPHGFRWCTQGCFDKYSKSAPDGGFRVPEDECFELQHKTGPSRLSCAKYFWREKVANYERTIGFQTLEELKEWMKNRA